MPENFTPLFNIQHMPLPSNLSNNLGYHTFRQLTITCWHVYFNLLDLSHSSVAGDKNVGLIDESFHKDILRNQEDLSISKTCKDGVLFYSWHLKDIEKYKEVQEMFADEFSKSVKYPTSSPSPHDLNCTIVYSEDVVKNGTGLFIERERTVRGQWLYKPGYIENNEKVLITREWMERWLSS